jgi:hypothetical protein
MIGAHTYGKMTIDGTTYPSDLIIYNVPESGTFLPVGTGLFGILALARSKRQKRG